MQAHVINELGNFIAGWFLPADDLCARLIDYHRLNPDSKPGRLGQRVDITKKDSVDCILEDQNLLAEYAEYLMQSVNCYKQLYPWCDNFSAWSILEPINIQHYQPGSAYHAWHTERPSAAWPSVTRHLVFMTYLNTIIDGGHTEWIHQNCQIQPQAGLTVIWPADWCFTHRGLVSANQDKYIITGWFNYQW